MCDEEPQRTAKAYDRSRFWGVFWIDASTKQGARQSFATIAKLAKVEPNERAVMCWLSSRKKPWLLIIDNVDDDSVPLDDCIPDGEGGFVLITTRDPSLRTQGTFGLKYFQFTELKEDDSNELLLKAAAEPTPWSCTSYDSASTICKTLGHLPLALLQAGKAIRKRLCTLQNYLMVWEQYRSRSRRKRSVSNIEESASREIVYFSCEIVSLGVASEETIELLKVCSFLHRQHIRVAILLDAIVNSSPEMKAAQRKSLLANSSQELDTQRSWSESLKDFAFRVFAFLSSIGERAVLPKVLQYDSKQGNFYELRLRNALTELHEMSLIEYNSGDDSFSMHALVHFWVTKPQVIS